MASVTRNPGYKYAFLKIHDNIIAIESVSESALFSSSVLPVFTNTSNRVIFVEMRFRLIFGLIYGRHLLFTQEIPSQLHSVLPALIL